MNAFSPRESTVISRAMGAVARDLLGEPNEGLSSKEELRFGTQGSTSVDLPKGTWFDHEAGQGGGVLDLVMSGATPTRTARWPG